MNLKEKAKRLKFLPSDLMRDFLNTEYYQAYEEAWYRNLGLSSWTQDVCNRVYDYAKFGGDGRTHHEVIVLQCDAVNDAGYDGILWDGMWTMLLDYLTDVQKWHDKNNSLYTIIG